MLSTLGESKFPEPEAPTFSITTRSGISTRDPPFLAISQSTPTNHAKGTNEREGTKVLEIDEDELVPIILVRPFLATARAVIEVHKGKLSMRVKNETVSFNIRKSMKFKHSHDDYMYCADHTAKLVREQWVDTVDHDGKWTEAEEEGDSNKVQAVSFDPRTEPVKPREWKAPENRLKPSSVEPPELVLKELPKHLEYAFLQENN
ncbi:hypothetical protein Tco_1556508 [Tanacetum coccineum]